MIKLGELVMILELHRQGLKVSAIARQLGLDCKTVRRYIERGLEPPSYGPRPPQPRSTDPFLSYLHERLAAYPSLPPYGALAIMRRLDRLHLEFPFGLADAERAAGGRGVRPDHLGRAAWIRGFGTGA